MKSFSDINMQYAEYHSMLTILSFIANKDIAWKIILDLGNSSCDQKQNQLITAKGPVESECWTNGSLEHFFFF